MKKLFFTLLTSITLISFGQAPKEISYQGVARNTTGSVLPNQTIGIKLDLHQGSTSGAVVFSESHNKTTNAFGLFTLGIGSVNTSGFTAINWANGPYFLEVSMDPAGGTSYTSVGTQQFMSVPYALYAETSGNASATPTITINAPNTVTSAAGSYTINVPAAASYSAGTGIDITGGVISNTVAAITPTIAAGNNITINPTAPSNSYTVSAPSYSLSQTGNNIDLLQNGTSIGTATLPVTTSYSAGNGIDITGGVISNTLTPITPTLSVSGNSISINPGNTQALPNYSLTQSGANIDLTQNGTSIATVTLTAATSTSLSAGSSNITLNQAGNAYTITPVTPTFTNNGSTTITGSYPNYTVNSVASPTTSLVAGNTNIQLIPGTNSYTLNAYTYSLTNNSNTLTLSNGAPFSTPSTVVLPTTATTSLVQGSNITLNNSGSTYTISAPAYSISLPGGNVVQISNGVSTSTAPISATNLTLNGPNNNVLSAGGNTVGLNTYTVGSNLNMSTGPNYTITAPSYSLTSNSNTLTLSNGTAITTATVPAVTLPLLSYTSSATEGKLQSGPSTNTVSIPNYTLSNTSNTITLNNGAASSTAIIPVPTLSLTGSTLTSGPSTNSVSLSGFNGIYGGSGAIQTGSTTVTVGTNTLTFLSGNTANKPIANFFGGGITGTSMTLGHVGANSANFKFVGSATTTPVDYGYVSGSTNGIAISGGTSTNGLYATNTAEVGVGTYTTGTGKFVITHTATQANPTMHLRETTGGLNRIKFSNNTVANKFFETAAQTNAVDANGAYSINYFDGATYKPVLLVTGDKKVNINNLNTVLGSLHVMENATTAGNGIISEGFAQAAQINLARNNQPALAARTAVVAGDELGRINFAGYDGAAFGDGAKIYAKAAENVTGSNKGTELIFSAVPTGTNTNKEVFKINGANKLEVITSMIIPAGAAAGKILTSDALGNASWQSGAGLSPWIQGASIVTQATLGDNVGIGINTPQSPLHIANAGGSQLRLGNNNQPTMEWMWNVDGTSHLSLVNENNGTAKTYMFMNVNNGNLGLGTSNPLGSLHLVNNLAGNVGAFIDMSATTNTDGVRVVQGGTGNGIFSGIYNASSPAKAVEAQSGGTGVTLGAANSGTGGAGDFTIVNAASNAIALSASSNGGGTVIYATNTNSSNISAVIQANSNSSGVAIYASNNIGSTSQFDNNSSSTAVNAINNSTGNALYASANTGNAINASSSGSTTPTALINNSGIGDGMQVFSSGSRAILAQSSSNGTAALEVNNTGNGNAITGIKGGTATSGNAGSFTSSSSSNTSDGVIVSYSGAAAAIHAISATTSTVGLWVQSGHLKSTQSAPPTSNTISVSGGGISGISVSLTNATDVKGTLNAVLTTTTLVNNGNNAIVQVTFNKGYSIIPTVVVTPLTDMLGMSYFVTNVTTSSFRLNIKNSTGLNLSSPASMPINFNYFVIE